MIKRYLLFLALLVAPSLSSALNLADIKTQVRFRMKDADADATRQRYSNPQLERIIREGHRFVCNTTWIIQKSTSFPLVSGTTDYTLPTDIFEITRVTHDLRLLPEKSKDALDADSGGWEEATGMPAFYYQDRTQPDSVSFTPVPDSSASTGTIIVDYIAQGNVLDIDEEEPFEGIDRYQAYGDILVYYTCYVLSTIENDARAQIWGQLFETELKALMDTVGVRPNYNPGFSGKRSP